MKLFKSLLVAPATLGLLAPLTASATEVNFNAISNYSEEEIEINSSSFTNNSSANTLLAGGEGMADSHNHDSNSFSETTTASFSADFAIGALEGKGISTGITDGDESVQAYYGFQIDLNTSFTGEDSLDISIDAGNGLAADPVAGVIGTPLAEFDLNGGSDALTVDGISYTFPVGDKMTVMVGDNTDGSAMFTTACAYGGPSNTLDDCGNVNAGITNGGAMAGASYDIGNGFTAAVGYAGPETGILTEGSPDAFGANVAYDGGNYGVSLTYGVIESGVNENKYTALNGYYSLDNGISLSAGYELGDIGGEPAASDESQAYFVGVNGEVGPGELGAAIGTAGSMAEVSGAIVEELMYEVYYSYALNDGMTVTPLIYVKEKATVGTPDETGVMVKTSFSF
jgi:hypothetical protein